MSEKLPAIQFYPGDWRKDPCVQALDHEHKGVWIDLLCIMAETTERGRLVLPSGAPMSDLAIARNLGIDLAHWQQVRSNLLALGVASEDEAGVLYNRRIAREEATRYLKVKAGRKGGEAKAANHAAKRTPSKNVAKASPSVAVAVAVAPSGEVQDQPRRVSIVENSGEGQGLPAPPDRPPADYDQPQDYTKNQILEAAKEQCGLGLWNMAEMRSANSVLMTWYGRPEKPETIWAAVHGARMLVDAGKVDWLKPRQPFGLKALNNSRTLAHQGNGERTPRLLFDVAAETYYRALDSPGARSKRGQEPKTTAELLAKSGAT